MFRVPAFKVELPEKVLVPLKVQVPEPDLVTAVETKEPLTIAPENSPVPAVEPDNVRVKGLSSPEFVSPLVNFNMPDSPD